MRQDEFRMVCICIPEGDVMNVNQLCPTHGSPFAIRLNAKLSTAERKLEIAKGALRKMAGKNIFLYTMPYMARKALSAIAALEEGGGKL